MRPLAFTAFALAVTAPLLAVNPDADHLMGIHWYPNTDSLSVGQATDVEAMSDGRPLWITEITHVDASVAPPWDQPGYFVGHSQKVMTGKGHSVIFRMQPYWDRHVPHPDDPYTLTNFTNDARSAADTLKDYCHIWQIGNEVNIRQENRRWNSSASAYNLLWQPTPAQYAETYVAIRDAIHDITSPRGPQQVLMQAVSPGPVDPTYRYMDGNEFLYRMIDAVADKSKIDGFALHGYAEPGGANFGVNGFMESIVEQLMIIDSFGLGDRPVYITEFNKHMPNATEANIGARFLAEAYQALHEWNTGTDGLIPGQPNHNIRSATWFVYPDGALWQDYSLLRWKTGIVSTNPLQNPWYAFRETAALDYPAGIIGGGATFPIDGPWWTDEFTSLNTTPGAPHWKVTPVTTGTASVVDGKVVLRGNTGSAGGASLHSAGYVYSNFNAHVDFTIVNGQQTTASPSEGNFDIRIREGSLGYSFTVYTSASGTRSGQAWLRRTNNWGENVGGFNASIPGGVNNGDSFRLEILADGPSITYTLIRRGETSNEQLLQWEVNDAGQAVGYVRIGTYNLREARLDGFGIGGLDWPIPADFTSATLWEAY